MLAPSIVVLASKKLCVCVCLLSGCIICVLQSFTSHLKVSIISDDGQSRKAARQDVVVRILCADVSRGAQEEAPGRAGRLCRVLKEMLGEVEGLYEQLMKIISVPGYIT